MGVLTSKWFWLAVVFAGWTAGVAFYAHDYGQTSVELDCTEATLDAVISTAAANTDVVNEMRSRYQRSLAEARRDAKYQKSKNATLRADRDAILVDTDTASIPADWMRKVSDAFNPSRVLAEPRAVSPGGEPRDTD